MSHVIQFSSWSLHVYYDIVPFIFSEMLVTCEDMWLTRSNLHSLCLGKRPDPDIIHVFAEKIRWNHKNMYHEVWALPPSFEVCNYIFLDLFVVTKQLQAYNIIFILG